MDRTYYARGLNAERLNRVYAVAGPRVGQYLAAEIAYVAQGLGAADRLLELGCGTGRVLAALSKKTGVIWGVDNAEESLRLAARLPGVRVAAMDAGALGFVSGRFDIVVGVQNFLSACKVPARQVIEEALRVVRSGGRVVLTSYAEQFWPHRLEWFRAQADEGLLGPIDEAATGDGVIACTDGFRATTVSPKEFSAMARAVGVNARVFTVDDSSVVCDIQAP